jgi:hypothetical protein
MRALTFVGTAGLSPAQTAAYLAVTERIVPIQCTEEERARLLTRKPRAVTILIDAPAGPVARRLHVNGRWAR